MKSLLIFLCLGLFLSSCGPKITTRTFITSHPPLDYRQEVTVFDLNRSVPQNAILIGSIKAGDTGFTTQNNYLKVIERLQEEARKSGANLIKINRHKNPNFWSSAHRISAELYYCDSIPLEKEVTQEAAADWDYALVHVYRLSGVGFLINYDLHLGDSVICRTKPNWKETVKVTATGMNTLWAKTEVKEELPVRFEKGREYYVRCGVQMGIMIGRPGLELVDPKIGKPEFEAIK